MSTSDGLLTYSKEQLEPSSRLLLSFVISYFISLLFALTFQVEFQLKHIVVPSLSTFLLLVYYRVSDEFKDFETDKKFFPDRPIPSGKITLKELGMVLIIVSALSIILNLFFPYAIGEFLAAFIFTFCMGKWFFMESIISKNRLIAFLTHAPVGIFMYGYTEKYLLATYQQHMDVAPLLSLICFILFPGLTWEVLRKTYLPKDEMPGYQIYSTMLGFRGALFFGLFWVVLTVVNNYLMIGYFPVLKAMGLPLLIINLVLSSLILKHAYKPFTDNLKKITEAYMGVHLILPILYLSWIYYVQR